jgi:hypothetical protein
MIKSDEMKNPSSQQIQQQKKGIERARLSRSDVELRSNESKYDSPLESFSIDGNATADPRSSSGEGKPLIGIVFNKEGFVSGNSETLFTAKIADYYQLLLRRIDTIFEDVVKSDVDGGTSVEDEDDADVRMSDEGDEGGVTGYDDDDEERGREEEGLVEEEGSVEEEGLVKEGESVEEEEQEEEEPTGRGRGRGRRGRGTGGEGRGTGGEGERERASEGEGSGDEEEDTTRRGRNLRKRRTGEGGGGRGGGIIGGGDRTGSSRGKRKAKGNRKVKPTGGHDENGSEQGNGREEDHIPDTTLENQSKDDDEDTNERICMKIVSIIHDIGQTLREQENCPCEEEIDEITQNFSRISQNTVLQLSLAATIEHKKAFMDSSHKSRTKQGGRDIDLCSTSSEEDEESESIGRSQFIVYEAVEASEEVDDEEALEAAVEYVENFSPDYEESEEVRN